MTNKIEKVLTFEEYNFYEEDSHHCNISLMAWNARQPEIDQLKERIRELEKTISSSLAPESSP